MNKFRSNRRVIARGRLLLVVTLGFLVAPFVSATALMKNSDRQAPSNINHSSLFADQPASLEIGFIEPILTPLVATVSGHGAIGLAKGDFNGDGKLDLAATFHDGVPFPPRGQVIVMLGNGDGTFLAPTTLFTLPENMYTRGILARDFDDDGKLDIVADVYELHEVLFFKGHGDGTFDAPIPSATNFGPAGVQTADLDGDGKLDLVTVDPGDNAVSVLLGNGNGTFNTPTDYTVSTRPWDVAIGDVNGDGARDLVVGIFGTKVIGVLLNKNDGSGGFLPVTNFSSKMNSRGLYLADFDSDGKLDVVVVGQDSVNDDGSSSSTDPCIAFMKGGGNGTFSSPASADFIGVSYRSSRQYSENVAPDINGDGKPDVVFAHEEDGNTISLGLSNGNGTFSMSFWVGWPGSGQGNQPPTGYFPDAVNGFDVLAGDFNGDGVTDFAVPIVGGDSAIGGVSIMFGNTPGTFRAPRIYQARGGDFRSAADRQSVVFGDFTSDGKVDMVALAGGGCPPDNLLDAFAGNGDGSLGNSIAATAVPACGGGDQVLRSADLDRNGTLDLLFLGFANNAGQNVGVVANGNGNGTFTLFGSFPLAAQGQNTVLADFDGDGFLDVAVFESTGCFFPNAVTNIEVLLQGAGGAKTFTSRSSLPVNGDCGGGVGMVAADFDRDGKVDLVAALRTGGTNNVLFFKGNGDGTFQNSTVVGTLATQFGINDYAAADLNGDGNLDLIGAGDGVWIQLGNGDGTFQAPVRYASFGVTALKLADFNGDGKLDIAIVGSLGVEFSVLPGNGDGTFGTPRKFAVGGRSINSLDVADVNGDGQPDLVVRHATTEVNNLFYTVLINNTNPVAPPPLLQSIAVSPATGSVNAGSTRQFTATGNYSDGSTQDLSTSVTWSSSNTSIATISNSAGSQGLATGVAAGGPVTITAAQGAISGTAQLTVTAVLQTITVAPTTASIPKGATRQFTSTGHYSDGSTQDLTTSVTWSSSNASIATISNSAGSQGLATGVATGGPVTITATQGAISGTAQLTVTAAVVVSIAVTPANAQIPVGASQQYVATAIFSDGATRDATKSATWTSSNTAIGTISRNGLSKAIGPGSSTISASTGGMMGTTTLTTFTLTVAPTSATISVGGTRQFTATANFANGSTANLTSVVTWKSSNMKVATINAAGLAQGLKAGKTTISATDMGVSVSATLTVQ